ncbi:MAG: hydantoinase B/oxoprolinase family protein [Gammaproteobacteria bacterium]|nr:hydantoinase B/oxoprolinase family protein [Gammaproteobacteria bacterium]
MKGSQAFNRQLVWDRLLAIVEDQAQALMRTAFSPVVREAGDLSAGVFDTQGNMLAQAVTGTPGHVNAMAQAVPHFLQLVPISAMKPGDVLITNDPWLATGHLNDFTLVTPTFVNGQVVALFASTSHIADVGGRGFGPDANDVYEEGIRIPIMYLFREGVVNESLIKLIKANVRDPVVAEGDLYSLAACNEFGSQKLIQACEEFGIKRFDEIGNSILKISKEAMQAEINKLAPGTHCYSMNIDGYDRPIHLQCSLTIKQDCIEIDFDGTSPISQYGINVPLPYAEAYACFGVRCLVGNDIPNNAGSLSTISVRAPKGSILNAEPPCAVSARHAIGQMLPDVVIGCLSQVLKDQVPCEGASCIWNPVLMNSPIASRNFDAPPFVINPIFNGGTGARNGKDGLSTTAFPSGVRTTSTEVNEVTSPLIFLKREFLPDTGGPGQFRGGLGQVIEIQHRHRAPFEISKMFERVKHAALGRNGANAGSLGRVYLRDGEEYAGKGKEYIPSRATLVMETPGGGGLGKPTDRDRKLVESDLMEELISAEQATSVYQFHGLVDKESG